MGLAKIYPYTKFEVSGFTRFRFTEEGLQFKIIGPCLDLTMPLWGYFVTREMGLAKIYPYTKYDVSSITRSSDRAHVPCNGWMRKGVCAQMQIQMGICRARLTNCPGALTECQNAM